MRFTIITMILLAFVISACNTKSITTDVYATVLDNVPYQTTIRVQTGSIPIKVGDMTINQPIYSNREVTRYNVTVRTEDYGDLTFSGFRRPVNACKVRVVKYYDKRDPPMEDVARSSKFTDMNFYLVNVR